MNALVSVARHRLAFVAAVGLGVAALGLAMPQAGATLPSSGLWAATSVSGVEAEHYSSMEGMANAADAVVVGRLKSIDPGPTYGEPGAESHFAAISLEVDEVLRGSLKSGWVLHHPMGDRDRTDELRRYISEDQAIYFLRDLEEEMLDLGFGATKAGEVAGAYRLVTKGAVINDDHGKAVVPITQEDAFDPVPGRDFQAVVADLRASSR